MASHARLSPSAAARWVACPGSVRLCEQFPDHSGRAAAEGTAFHHFVAMCLEQDIEPDEVIGRKTKVVWHTSDGQPVTETFVCTDEMAQHMVAGLERIRQYAERPGARLFVEQRVDLSWVLGEKAFGTADVIVVNRQSRHLLVADWKYGAGVPVSPKENMQAVLYALGAWKSFVPKALQLVPSRMTVEILIEQPRIPAGGGSWTLGGDKLLAWRDRFAAAAEATRQEDPPLVPGSPQCDFCAAARNAACPAVQDRVLSLLDVDMDAGELDTPGALAKRMSEFPPVLEPAQRVEVLKAAKLIRGWLDALERQTVEDLLAGHDIPGVRLVPGRRPPRRWTDEERVMEIAEKALGEEAFERRLKTLSRLEKQMGKKAFDKVFGGFVSQGEPKPVLAFDTPEEGGKPDYRDALGGLKALGDV